MKNLLLGLSLVLSVSSAHALSSNSKFFTIDNSIDSQLCFIAATEGYDAALTQGKKIGGKYSHLAKETSCNGVSIREFASMHKNNTAEDSERLVNLFAGNETRESQICLKAAKTGIKSIEKNRYFNNIKCNGQSIEKFVKQYGKN
mgnify:CR=1 FL=1